MASIRDLFEVGGEVEIAYQRQQDFDLDRSERDDLDLLPVELKLEVLFAPNDYVEAFLQTTLFHAFTLRDEGEDDVDATDLFVEEAYLTLTKPDSGLALQVGRQSFEDPRQWLYDAELDAVRARYRASWRRAARPCSTTICSIRTRPNRPTTTSSTQPTS